MHDTGINRLDRAVDPKRDHILGPESAGITLVEYGSYACPYCRAANDAHRRGARRPGDRLRYVFRHKPLTGSDIARRAAVLAELAPDNETFWRAHVTLMTRSATADGGGPVGRPYRARALPRDKVAEALARPRARQGRREERQGERGAVSPRHST